MALPQFTIKDLLEAGAHFGHRTYRWNPKMSEYIYGKRNGVHIIDLQKTVPLFYNALAFLRQTAANGGRVLFVGTKRAAQAPVKEAAERCGQYYMNHRWLGGSLTNWKTITRSIKRLRELDKLFTDGTDINATRTKKERLMLEREYAKLSRALSGVEGMGGLPSAIIVTDVVKDALAIQEANCLGIPVIGILDTNSSPDGVDFPIPANDDAARALRLYTRLMADAVLDGISTQVAKVEKRVATNKASGNKDGGKVKLSAAAQKASDEAKVEVVKKPVSKKVSTKPAESEVKTEVAPKAE